VVPLALQLSQKGVAMGAARHRVQAVRALFIVAIVGTLLGLQSAAQSVMFQRGERVRVKAPSKPSEPKESNFSVTVVAIPNDRIRVHDSNLYVNDQAVRGFSQDLMGHVAHSKHTPRVVPDGSYFVMGEHQWTLDDTEQYWGTIPATRLEMTRQPR
jgi:Signal peptidase, peptidase S26